MKDLTCDEVMERVPALVVGDLSPVEEAEIDLHTAYCKECAVEVRQGRALADALDRLKTEAMPAERISRTVPDLRARIMGALPREAAFERIDSPIGPLYVVATDAGLWQVRFGGSDAEVASAIAASDLRPVRSSARLGPYLAQLGEYFAGKRSRFDLPVDLSSTTPFARRVLEATAAVPFGRLASYRDIALAIGQPGATRAVGNALGSNPVPIVIPCHRVVRSDGSIGGYTGGLAIKWRLLELEGVTMRVHDHETRKQGS